MAALMTLTIEYSDGKTVTRTILPKTLVAFERHFSMGIGAISSETRMEHIFWLAWDAERTATGTAKPFDDWLDDVVSVNAEDDAVPLDTESSLPAA
jgi:hypothetical protein